MYRDDNDSLVDTQLLNTLLVYDMINTSVRNNNYTPEPPIAWLPLNDLYEFAGVYMEGWMINMLNWSTRGWFLINPIKLFLLLVFAVSYVVLFFYPNRRVG